jgi:Spy/CpxP family protein refolding chaperone
MRNAFLFLTAAALVLTLGTVILDSPGSSAVAAPLGATDDPQAVSPADPKTPPPPAGSWVCPACGAECCGPVRQHKGRLDRPQLGPGRDFGHGSEWGRNARPGRWGRDGDRRGRHGMDARPRSRTMARADRPVMGARGARGGFAAEMVLRRANDLKLTEDQIGKLEGLASDTKKKLVDLHAEIQKSEIEIQDLLRSESDDLTAIKRHLSAASKARAAIQEARITHLFEVRKVLTAEQKKMLKQEFPRMGRIID